MISLHSSVLQLYPMPVLCVIGSLFNTKTLSIAPIRSRRITTSTRILPLQSRRDHDFLPSNASI